MSNIDKLIKTLVTESIREIKLFEKLRGNFNLNEFMKLTREASLEDLEKYLRDTLGEPIGKGSSRIVWPLSSTKVIKLARARSGSMAGAGQAQNEAEVDLWTNPKARTVIAKIYNYDPEFKWIISELTKPLSMQDIEKIFNTTHDVFNSILKMYLEKDSDPKDYFGSRIKTFSNKKAYFEKRLKIIEAEIEKIKKADPEFKLQATAFKMREKENERLELERTIKEINFEIENLSSVNLDKLIPVMEGIKAMKEELGFVVDDIIRYEHYGRTADGRIVVIDYGITDEIYAKHYK